MLSLIRRVFDVRRRRVTDDSLTWEGPFHVWCVAPRPLRVDGQDFQLEDARADHDGRVYVVRGLTALHLLSGEDYILVSDELGDVLVRCCPGSVELLRADITDVPTGKRLEGYSELRTRDEIAYEGVPTIRDPNPRVWNCRAGGSHLFVTKPVVHSIQQAHILGVRFSPGLSAFIGGLAVR